MLLLVIITVCWAWALIRQAGVFIDDFVYTALGAGLALAITAAAGDKYGAFKNLDRKVVALASILAIVPLLQLVPLPVSLVSLLSPVKAEAAGHVRQFLPATAWLPVSVAPARTAEKLVNLLTYLAFFLLAAELVRRFKAKPWIVVAPIAIFGFFEGLLGIVQYYLARNSGVQAMATGTYANRNHFAGLLELSLPLVLVGGLSILQTKSRRRVTSTRKALIASGLFTAATVMLLAIIHSLSRMGFLSALAGILAIGSVALRPRPRPGSGFNWKQFIPALGLGVAVALAFVLLPPDDLIARFAQFAATDDVNGGTRAQIWQNSRHVISHYLLTGSGFGTYESALYRYKEVAPLYTVDYAHNDYLQVLGEMGIFAFAAGLGLLYFVLRNALSAVHIHAGEQRSFVALACIGGLFSMLLHSFVDFNLYIPANAIAIAWIAGVAYALGASARNQQARPL